MESFEQIFRVIGALHGIAGLVMFTFSANEDFQKSCFYKGRNPLVGELCKHLAYFGCCALMACGISAFLVPKLAVVFAWLSLVFYISTGIVDLIAERRWPAICKACAISFLIRVVAAVTLTGIIRQWE